VNSRSSLLARDQKAANKRPFADPNRPYITFDLKCWVSLVLIGKVCFFSQPCELFHVGTKLRRKLLR
jgi:hypothetical protein